LLQKCREVHGRGCFCLSALETCNGDNHILIFEWLEF
jgi:hypothetical protein